MAEAVRLPGEAPCVVELTAAPGDGSPPRIKDWAGSSGTFAQPQHLSFRTQRTEVSVIPNAADRSVCHSERSGPECLSERSGPKSFRHSQRSFEAADRSVCHSERSGPKCRHSERSGPKSVIPNAADRSVCHSERSGAECLSFRTQRTEVPVMNAAEDRTQRTEVCIPNAAERSEESFRTQRSGVRNLRSLSSKAGLVAGPAP